MTKSYSKVRICFFQRFLFYCFKCSFLFKKQSKINGNVSKRMFWFVLNVSSKSRVPKVMIINQCSLNWMISEWQEAYCDTFSFNDFIHFGLTFAIDVRKLCFIPLFSFFPLLRLKRVFLPINLQSEINEEVSKANNVWFQLALIHKNRPPKSSRDQKFVTQF